MSYYYNDVTECTEYHGEVIHAVEIGMKSTTVKLRFNSDEAAYSVLSALLDNKPIGFLGAVRLIESDDGRPLYEE